MHNPRGANKQSLVNLTGQLVHPIDENQSVREPSQKTKVGNTRAVMPKLILCPWACTQTCIHKEHKSSFYLYETHASLQGSTGSCGVTAPSKRWGSSSRLTGRQRSRHANIKGHEGSGGEHRESKLPPARGDKTDLTKTPWRQRVTPARHKSQLQEKSLVSRKMTMG